MGVFWIVTNIPNKSGKPSNFHFQVEGVRSISELAVMLGTSGIVAGFRVEMTSLGDGRKAVSGRRPVALTLAGIASIDVPREVIQDEEVGP